MREVTKDQFYAKIGPLQNVVGRIVNNKWPYTHEFYIQSSSYNIIGRIVGEIYGEYGVFHLNRYYLA